MELVQIKAALSSSDFTDNKSIPSYKRSNLKQEFHFIYSLKTTLYSLGHKDKWSYKLLRCGILRPPSLYRLNKNMSGEVPLTHTQGFMIQ